MSRETYQWQSEWVPTMAAAAARLGVNPSTITRWAKSPPGLFRKTSREIDVATVRLWRRLTVELGDRPVRTLDMDLDD